MFWWIWWDYKLGNDTMIGQFLNNHVVKFLAIASRGAETMEENMSAWSVTPRANPAVIGKVSIDPRRTATLTERARPTVGTALKFPRHPQIQQRHSLHNIFWIQRDIVLRHFEVERFALNFNLDKNIRCFVDSADLAFRWDCLRLSLAGQGLFLV